MEGGLQDLPQCQSLVPMEALLGTVTFRNKADKSESASQKGVGIRTNGRGARETSRVTRVTISRPRDVPVRQLFVDREFCCGDGAIKTSTG
jgi:hypothetical protein